MATTSPSASRTAAGTFMMRMRSYLNSGNYPSQNSFLNSSSLLNHFDLSNLSIIPSHLLVAFGAPSGGLESAVDADEDLKCAGEDAAELFDRFLNPCPRAGSRTIRTEVSREAGM